MGFIRNMTLDSRTFRYSAPVAAGQDGGFVALGEIDTRGFTACRITPIIGTVTATGVFASRVKNYATTGGQSAVGSTVGVITSPVTGLVTVASDQNGLLFHDIWKPQERFLRAEYQRTVANVVIDAYIVELYHADDKAVAQAGADVHANEILNQPLPSAV